MSLRTRKPENHPAFSSFCNLSFLLSDSLAFQDSLSHGVNGISKIQSEPNLTQIGNVDVARSDSVEIQVTSPEGTVRQPTDGDSKVSRLVHSVIKGVKTLRFENMSGDIILRHFHAKAKTVLPSQTRRKLYICKHFVVSHCLRYLCKQLFFNFHVVQSSKGYDIR